jgi:ATP-binding cassette subfamily F protein uup
MRTINPLNDNLIILENISLAFGLNTLLDRVKLIIQSEERVCLIGRNGTGKSSLFKIIDGSYPPDSGSIWKKANLKIARLEQELPLKTKKTIYEFVAEGIDQVGKLLSAYQALTHRLTHDATSAELLQLEKLQHQLDATNGWNFDQTIQTVLVNLDLNPDELLVNLSGGWQRRAALAKVLVTAPDLILLDEPTNHLDIKAIQWLENYLLSLNIGIVFITHDRSLLQRLATRIIELDRGQLTSFPGDYPNFLRRKEEMLHAEAVQNAEFDKKLSAEERWIRQGIKARRTRNEGRVRALEALRLTRSKRREIQGKVDFKLNEAKQSGQLVVDAEHITHGFKDKILIRDFSLRIIRGDRIGLVGPNGVGKTTLLAILLGQLTPDKGTIKIGTQLQVAYFDQLRMALDLNKTVVDNVAEGLEYIEIDGKKQHIIGYLGNFLFTPERALTPVKALSGGECNRLLLARLFSRPSNILVMDEPTNDLDMETLELLEDLLTEYRGTLLLVSHDRTFLNNVVTSTLLFEGDGQITEHVGAYEPQVKISITPPPIPKAQASSVNTNKKVLDEITKKINKLEKAKATLQATISHNDFYLKSKDEIKEATLRFQQLEAEIAAAYAEWEKLESK